MSVGWQGRGAGLIHHEELLARLTLARGGPAQG